MRDHSDSPTSLLSDVPSNAPALARALEISERAVSVGFEWDTLDEVWRQAREEVRELSEAYDSAPKQPDGRISSREDAQTARHEAALELGDVLFSLVNVGRKMGLDAEAALHATCSKFSRRWEHMEQLAAKAGTDLESVDRNTLEDFWSEAKRFERSETNRGC